MKNTLHHIALLAVVLTCVTSVRQATAQSAELLFKDTFTATNSNMDVYAGGGQSGSLTVPISYNFTGANWQTQISGNNALIYANGNTASFALNHNFTNSQNLLISSTFTRPQATAWIKFGSGLNADYNAAGGAAFAFDNTSALYLGTLLQANNTLVIEAISSANYDGSGTVDLNAWLNNAQLDLNGAGAGNTYTISGGFTQNYITHAQFSGGFSSWSVEDWQVEAVPEPSTYALLVLGAAGVVAHVARRRRLR
jgi:hypothetical protein